MSDCIIPPKQTVTVTEYLPAVGDTYCGSLALTAKGSAYGAESKSGSAPDGALFATLSITGIRYYEARNVNTNKTTITEYDEVITTGTKITSGGTFEHLKWSSSGKVTLSMPECGSFSATQSEWYTRYANLVFYK